MRHFLTLNDFSKDEIFEILDLAKKIKSETKQKIFKPYLKDQYLAMIFEKSSTRTRVSFEVGISQLGGKGLFLSSNDIQLGRGEPVKDTARVLGRMCDMIMARVNNHETLIKLSKFSGVPVINGLSEKFHPVQLMADLLTAKEYNKNLEKMKVSFIGDGFNMANSWAIAASKIGFTLHIATPKNYEISSEILDIVTQNSKKSGAKIICDQDIKNSIQNADIVTTDTWISMGQENEKEKRIKDFSGFCVDENLMKLAQKDAIFLHCLPAYRGYEVSENVFESHADEIFDEAENRLHAQKGVMVWLNNKLKA